jgi:hypothetical protein
MLPSVASQRAALFDFGQRAAMVFSPRYRGREAELAAELEAARGAP